MVKYDILFVKCLGALVMDNSNENSGEEAEVKQIKIKEF
jgi:hypothetical protein